MEALNAREGERETALDKLVVELDRLIVDESTPGTRLPSEGELAIRFGVSRITVREAMKVLAGRDLVDLGTGRRAIVKAPTSSTLAAHLDVMIRRDPSASLELNEIRAALEVQAATLAARRSSEVEIANLRNSLDAMTLAMRDFAETGDAEPFHAADIEFHQALARASGNQMLALVLASLEDSLRRSFARSFRGHLLLGEPIQASVDTHERVYVRIVGGDSRGAAAAMRMTLHQSNRNLRAALPDSQR